jgi:hypothetical protein
VPTGWEIIEVLHGWRELCRTVRTHLRRPYRQREFVCTPQRQRKLVAHLTDRHGDLASSARRCNGHVAPTPLDRLNREECEQLHLRIGVRQS